MASKGGKGGKSNHKGSAIRRDDGKGHVPWSVQKAIVGVGDDRKMFLDVLNYLCSTSQKLRPVEIATILQRSGKFRLCLEEDIVAYLANALKSKKIENFGGLDAQMKGDHREP